MTEFVVLVDKEDNPIGKEEKLRAHLKGSLHRAFSLFVFNSREQLLIQKRSDLKYHTPGLWSNSCCSHPRPGETSFSAAKRRISEEMGFSCNIRSLFSCYYYMELNNKLIEHEKNQILIGNYDGEPNPDPQEVSDWKWLTLDNLTEEIKVSPGQFTPWFLLIMKQYFSLIGDALKDLQPALNKNNPIEMV